MPSDETQRHPTPNAVLTGTVRRLVEHTQGFWAEIVIDGADDLYCEIRVPHPIQNADGTISEWKPGDRVTLTIKLA
jgi:hypothetical protein